MPNTSESAGSVVKKLAPPRHRFSPAVIDADGHVTSRYFEEFNTTSNMLLDENRTDLVPQDRTDCVRSTVGFLE